MRRAFALSLRPATSVLTSSSSSSFFAARFCATEAAAAAAPAAAATPAAPKKKEDESPESLIDSILAADDAAALSNNPDDESLAFLNLDDDDSVGGVGSNKGKSPEVIRVIAAANQLARAVRIADDNIKRDSNNNKNFTKTSSSSLAAPPVSKQTMQTAARVFASVAPHVATVPVLVIARLLAHNWPATVCTPEMRKRLRREVFQRIGDLHTGDDVARVLVAWSANAEHAADLGMFKKLGKLLEFHMHTVHSAQLLMAVVRSLRRARIQPPPEFIDLLSRRLVVVQRNAEIRAKMMLQASSSNAISKNKSENSSSSSNVVAVVTPSSSSSAAAAADNAVTLLAPKDCIRGLRLFAGFGAASIPRYLVISFMRVIASSLEKRLVARGVIDTSSMSAEELLGSYPSSQNNSSSNKDGDVEKPTTKTPKKLTYKMAVAILRAERLGPVHLAYLLSTLSTYRITTTKYTRPFTMLMTAVAPQMRSSVFFGLFVPALLRFPSGTECTGIMSKQIVSRITASGGASAFTVNWEELVNSARLIVNHLEHTCSNDLAALSGGDDEASSGNSNSDVSESAKKFFESISKKLIAVNNASSASSSASSSSSSSSSQNVRAPTSWQMLLTARYMQRAAKADTETLGEVVTKQGLPAIASRFALLLDMGLVPLRHYDHLDETLTLALGSGAAADEPAVQKLRAVRCDIEEKDEPYSRRFAASAIFVPLQRLNESQSFSADGLLEPAQRAALREFSATKLVPCHPLLLLKALHAFDVAFPRVLQPAIRREFAIVMERKLHVRGGGKGAQSSASGTPGHVNIVPAGSRLWTNKPVSFESKEALREFVDLFWKAAPKSCRTSAQIWEFVAQQAEQHKDEVLARKAKQIVATLRKLRL